MYAFYFCCGIIYTICVITLLQVAAAQEIVKEQLATAADNIEVPPVEIPSNTEDIIRQRQLQA
jgi:hypothetical protein